MRVLLLAVMALSACGPLMPIRMDGGTAGGSGGGLGVGGGFVSGGGFTTAGGNAAGGNVGGGSTAGGSAAGGAAGGSVTAGGSAGGSVDAGLGNFVWSNLAVLPAPSSSFTYAVAVASRPGEAWAGLDNGKIYRSTGGAFNEVVGFSLSGINDLYVSPMGKVFAVTQGRQAAHCLAADCSAAANFTTVTVMPTSTENLKSLCGSGERVMALGTRDTNGIGTLYEFDPMLAQWTKVSNNLGISTPRGCVIGPGGEVYVVGELGVIRYENGATTPETIDLMGQPSATWTGIALWTSGASITEAMLVGSGSGYRFARRNNTAQSWTSLMPNTAGSAMYTVMALSSSEFLGAGSGTAANKFMMWNGTTWVPAVPAPPNTIGTVRDACVTDAREVFLVGLDGSSSYSIIRGRR